MILLFAISHNGLKTLSSHILTKLVSNNADLWKLHIFVKPHTLEQHPGDRFIIDNAAKVYALFNINGPIM